MKSRLTFSSTPRSEVARFAPTSALVELNVNVRLRWSLIVSQNLILSPSESRVRGLLQHHCNLRGNPAYAAVGQRLCTNINGVSGMVKRKHAVLEPILPRREFNYEVGRCILFEDLANNRYSGGHCRVQPAQLVFVHLKCLVDHPVWCSVSLSQLCSLKGWALEANFRAAGANQIPVCPLYTQVTPGMSWGARPTFRSDPQSHCRLRS
jgi:hypothetical protein